MNGLRPALFNQNSTAISSFASLPTNQNSSIMTNPSVQFSPIRTVLFGPIKLCRFGFLICTEMDHQSGTWAGTAFIKVGLLFASVENTSFHLEAVSLHLQTVYLRVSPFTTLTGLGTPVVIRFVAVTFS